MPEQHHIYGDPKCPCPRCNGANPTYLPIVGYTPEETRVILAALKACGAESEEIRCALDATRAAEAYGMFLDREARCDWPRAAFADAFAILATHTPCHAFLQRFPQIERDVSTGGGCMAWELTLPSGEHLMFTAPEGAYMPGPEDETVTVGYYDARGEWDEADRPDYSWPELTAFVSGFLAGKAL